MGNNAFWDNVPEETEVKTDAPTASTTEKMWENAPSIEEEKPSYEGKIEASTKTQIDKMYDMNSQAIDKIAEENPEMKFIAESKKAENELKRKEAYTKAYTEQKKLEKLDEAKTTGELESVSPTQRATKAAQNVSMQVANNLVAPILNKVGGTELAASIEAEAKIAQESLAKIEATYKSIYGEDAMNIAGGVAEAVPNLAGGAIARGKTLVEAPIEAGIEYAKTGDVKQAALAGLIDAGLGKVADVLLPQEAKKVFSKDIEDLPYDTKIKVKDSLEAAYDAGVQRLDAEGRNKILSSIDFTKSSKEVSAEIRDRLSMLKEAKKLEVDTAYETAHTAAKQTADVPVQLSEINKMIMDKNILKDKNVGKAINDIKGVINAARKSTGKTDLNAYDMEGILSTLKANQRSADGRGAAAYGEAIDYFTTKQKSLVGDLYEQPRAMSKEFNTRFKGTIDAKGVDTGKIVSTSLEKEKTYGEARNLVGETFDANKVDDLLDYKIPENVRVDMVKDVLVGDTPLDEIDTEDAVIGIVSRWKNADKTGLKNMLGKDYNKVAKQIGALDLIQNTMSIAQADKKVLKSVADFALNASMLKISPLFAYKGMVHEGKNIATAIAFKKRATELKTSLKYVKDRKVANSILRGLNVVLASTAAEKAFDKEGVETYPKDKVRMQED